LRLKAWTEWTLWTKWTETLFTLRVGRGCVHCVHNVHSVHALLNDSKSRLPNLGSPMKSQRTGSGLVLLFVDPVTYSVAPHLRNEIVRSTGFSLGSTGGPG